MNLDPRTKLFLLALTSVSVFMNERWEVECLLVIAAMLLQLSAKNYTAAFRGGLGFGFLMLLPLRLIPLLPPAAGEILFIFSTYIRKLIPCFMLGNYLIATTKVSRFMAAVHRMKVPKGLAIALSITLRYFPAMKEEWTLIREAMALRGISGSLPGILRHPVKTMEYIYVPMLVSASKISDEITQAAVTRGIDHLQRRSCIEKIGFSAQDAGAVLLYLFILSLI